MQVQLNKKNENPFYGMKACLTLQQNQGALSNVVLDRAWAECKDVKEKRELFFSLFFNVGDITNREHNIFKKKKVDSGGNSQRENFYIAMNWLKQVSYEQFRKFMFAHLFNEYSCFDNLFRNRVKTSNKTVEKVFNNYKEPHFIKDLLDFVEHIIKGNNPFDKLLVAKFLTPPRLSKRKGKDLRKETVEVMKAKANFLEMLSNRMNWEFDGSNFIGYRNWRKGFNENFESVLFSTKAIHSFDKSQFIEWLNQLPAQARFRVKNRIMYPVKGTSEYKYANLKNWYELWEGIKAEKQQEERILNEKVRQGTATVEDQVKLKQVKKEAKVTTGASNFSKLYNDSCKDILDPLELESFANKVNLPYNSLVIVDRSGSMSGAPFNFAKFIATICLAKNPDDTGRSMLAFFDGAVRIYTCVDSQGSAPNSLLKKTVQNVSSRVFINPTKSLYENYKNVSNFITSVGTGGWTDFGAIPQSFGELTQKNPLILEELRNFPIWTVISDSDWNQLDSPEASLNDFFRKCQQHLGFKPFVIAIGIENGSKIDVKRFSGIENFIMVKDPAQIEQVLLNFKDIDVMDVYTPLLSLYRSNRYELVRQNTL